MHVRRPVLVLVPLALVSLGLTLGLGATGADAHQAPTDTPRAVHARPTADDLPAGSVVADEQVSQLLRRGDRVYARGYFGTIGTYAGPGDVLDAATGAPTTGPEIADGQVSVVVADGSGGWFLGGDFTRIAGSPAGGLAHVLADGSLDTGFLPVTNGLVSAIALQGTTLYVGGSFSKVDGTTRKGLAAVSTAGALLPFAASQTARVTELAASATAVYVGTDHVTALDPVTGAALPAFGATVSGPVHALTLGGSHLYVGTSTLVSLDPVTGAVDPAFHAPGGEGSRSYESLLWTSSVLYAGSDREQRVVALDPATGAADPTFAPQLSGSNGTFGGPGGVYDLALDGSRLWAGGSFTSVAGQAAHGLAVLDASTGAQVAADLPAYNQQVNAVELSGGKAFVGGTFWMTHWVRTSSIAALDATTLQPVPGFHSDATHAYGDLLASSKVLYLSDTHFYGYDPSAEAAGSHEFYDSYPRRIRAYDPDTGKQLKALSVRLRGLTGVTTIGDRLYVAQRLGDHQRFPHNRIYVYDAHGKQVATYRVPLRGYITALSSVDGDLVAAGSFKRTTALGGPHDTALLRMDPRTGARRASYDPRIDGPTYDVASDGGALYASGLFTNFSQGKRIAGPGLTRVGAHAVRSDDFVPAAVNGDGVLLRLTPVGDLLFVDGGRHQHFLDAETGAEASDPTHGWRDGVWGISTMAGGDAFASSLDPNLGGRDALKLGFVAPTG